jgi:hypothetical protein
MVATTEVSLIPMQVRNKITSTVLNISRLERLRGIIKESLYSNLYPKKEWSHKVRWAINILDEEIRRSIEIGKWRREK